MSILEFIFRDFWTFAGVWLLLYIFGWAIANFRLVDKSTNYYTTEVQPPREEE